MSNRLLKFECLRRLRQSIQYPTFAACRARVDRRGGVPQGVASSVRMRTRLYAAAAKRNCQFTRAPPR
jgi:hypothetical protein